MTAAENMLAALTFELQMDCCAEYARSRVCQIRRDRAEVAIRAMLERCERPYVSCSWGKDSVCMTHMIYQQAPQLPVLFLASGESWDMHDFARVIEAFRQRWPVDSQVIQTEHFGRDKHPTWQASRDAGDRDLQQMASRDEFDGVFIGLRAHESTTRGRALAMGGNVPGAPREIYRYVNVPLFLRCCPLAAWTLLDVGAYIIDHELPLLRLYPEQGLHMRTTGRVTRKMAENNGLAWLKATSMSSFNALVREYEELTQYT